MSYRGSWWVAALLVAISAAAASAAYYLPALGASGLLHPFRRPVSITLPVPCVEESFPGAGVTLRGWRCRASAPGRGTIVYLHGIADNRASAVGVIERFTSRGYDVIAYDSRAHGESGGQMCTYGFYERQDLRAVLEGIDTGPIVLLGTSLGAAVALQAAAAEPRVAGVVAAETFADLRTVAADRAPSFFTARILGRAFDLAEKLGQFDVDAVSPVEAARHVEAAVLLIHGDADMDTPADHSRRVFAALRGPKRLLLVPGAVHNGSLRGAEVWQEIEAWIESVTRVHAGRRGKTKKEIAEAIVPATSRLAASRDSTRERTKQSGCVQ